MLQRNDTTDLDALREGALFVWGELVEIHTVGEYAIVECIPWASRGARVLTGTPDFSRRSFHSYIGGKCTAHSSSTLDSALVDCITIKHEGPNSQAGLYFLRGIGALSKEA